MFNLITLLSADDRKYYYSNGHTSPQGFHEDVRDATLYPNDGSVGQDFVFLRSTLQGSAIVRDVLVRPVRGPIQGTLAIEEVGMQSTSTTEIRV
jgi:hypothetical protein